MFQSARKTKPFSSFLLPFKAHSSRLFRFGFQTGLVYMTRSLGATRPLEPQLYSHQKTILLVRDWDIKSLSKPKVSYELKHYRIVPWMVIKKRLVILLFILHVIPSSVVRTHSIWFPHLRRCAAGSWFTRVFPIYPLQPIWVIIQFILLEITTGAIQVHIKYYMI